MKQLENDPVTKRMYEPPKIMTISLRPEEAVLGNCKISASPGLGFPTSCNFAGNCKTIGS